MRLWTIQPIEIWELLQKQGVYYGTLDYVDEDYIKPYNWMKKQLSFKTGINKENYSVWAWYKKPDLRMSGWTIKGEKSVCIEFEIDEKDVLLSDEVLWHYVLGYWYLPSSMEDGDKFNKKLDSKGLSFYKQKPLPEPYNKMIEDSWLKIFDLNWYVKDISDKRENKCIQAVFWELRLDQIKKVREFIAR
jgi:hypothetical protein